MRKLFKPNEEWGPALEENRTGRYANWNGRPSMTHDSLPLQQAQPAATVDCKDFNNKAYLSDDVNMKF